MIPAGGYREEDDESAPSSFAAGLIGYGGKVFVDMANFEQVSSERILTVGKIKSSKCHQEDDYQEVGTKKDNKPSSNAVRYEDDFEKEKLRTCLTQKEKLITRWLNLLKEVEKINMTVGTNMGIYYL
ncbi:hypothetical protein L2E82_13676 [Cichorium intybus]|uniref:Uncharacterized protein n=1 Tax=Cichorium intybus TaxID=13427 RepID=A0ACB9EXV6_CICIN|nr:hypothetical protein L2E82_13676 [Cichorium intybus]